MLQNQVIRTEFYSRETSNICLNTQQACLETARHCIEMGGDYTERTRLLLDTAALCHTVLDTACRTAWLHAHAISVCAEMCARTARVCDAYPDDSWMLRCASLCRECVKYCIEQSGASVA